MGNSRKHFGHDPAKAGKKAGKQMREGKISKDELKKRYQEAKDIGYGEEFKTGYAEGAEG